MRKLITLGLAAALLVSAQTGHAKKKGWDDDWYPPPPPPGQYKKHHGGPPPWAPAPGYRAKQRYRYYPRYNIYQDPASGLYFYFHGGAWTKGPLPPGVPHNHLGNWYMFQGDVDAPYHGNDDHRSKYKYKYDDKHRY